MRRHKSRKRRVKSHRGRWFVAIIVLLLVGFGVFMYCRSLPVLYPISSTASISTQASTVSLAWPAASESAIGASGYGVLVSNGLQTMKPIASTAKLITALTVLKKYPLEIGQQGPTITLGSADVDLYNSYLAEDGSVVKVTAGEQISEYQMLEAMLLPSANNIADSLAIWAFGSLSQYSVSASQLITSLDLNSTKVDSDASGFSPQTESTAHDLVILGQAAIKNPVVAQIVSQKQATVPVAGSIQNVNWLLGTDGIIGIKTGNTDQAGGVYVFAVTDTLGSGHSVTIIGAIQGSPTLQDALNAAVPLINSAKNNFKIIQTIQKGQVVAYYKVPWANYNVKAVATQSNSGVVWAGLSPKPILALRLIRAPQNSAAIVGSMTTSNSGTIASTTVVLKQRIPAPPWWWRIVRHNLKIHLG